MTFDTLTEWIHFYIEDFFPPILVAIWKSLVETDTVITLHEHLKGQGKESLDQRACFCGNEANRGTMSKLGPAHVGAVSKDLWL